MDSVGLEKLEQGELGVREQNRYGLAKAKTVVCVSFLY